MSQAKRRKPLAMGRVNSYMTGKGGARPADAKIYSKYQKKR